MGDVCRVGYNTGEKGIGIAPVIHLNLNTSENWSYVGTVSTNDAKDQRDSQNFVRKNGIQKNSAGTYEYYQDGMIDRTANGIYSDGSNYYYVKNGSVNEKFTGLADTSNGEKYYIKNGISDKTVTALVYDQNTWYYIENGKWNSSYTGYVLHTDQRWYYVRNGKIDFTFTGLAKHTDGKWYYAEKGILDWGYSGIASNEYKHWYCVKSGIYDPTQNGLTYYGGTWYYVTGGEWNREFNGYVQHVDGQWYYVKNGKIDFTFTGLAKHTDNCWYYANHGIIDWGYSGLAQSTDGAWFYVSDGRFDSSYTGLIQYGGDWYYLKNGYLDWTYSSLVRHVDGQWYYVNNGKLNWSYNGLVQYYSTWYYVENGRLNWNYTGLTEYYGTWYYVENGTLNWNYSNLVYYNGIWYYVKNGRIDWTYEDLILYEGIWYYIQNAKIDWNYNGLAEYYGVWYYIANGKLDWNYTGLTEYYGTWYYVENGRLNWGYTGLVQHFDGVWYYVQNGRINWNCTTLVKHSDGVWYYVDNAKINWNYTNPFQYYSTWYYIQGGKLNWNYSGSGIYEGIPYTVRNGIVYFDDQAEIQVQNCQISSHSKNVLTLQLTAKAPKKVVKGELCVLMMDSAGNEIVGEYPATVSRTGNWILKTEIHSNDEFRTAMMACYAVGEKTGNGYHRISNSCMIENPEATASMTKAYKGYYNNKNITSKKGMQGVSDGYTEDVGVQHVLLNVDIADMVSLSSKAGYVPYTYKGKTYYFQDLIALTKTIRYLNGWDNNNPYGWHNRSVTLVLLLSWKDDLTYLIHPSARIKGASYYALNMKEDSARETFEALFCYMGEKLGNHKSLVSNWTLGNEVNSCNKWNYSGNLSLQENAANYGRAFQLLYQGVRRTASTSKIFISLDHCWNKADAGYAGKTFLDEFASYMNNTAYWMDWNVNYHPYSQPLMRNAFWSDNTNTTSGIGTAYISMKNINVLTDYLGTLESKYGKANGSIRVLLGELGYTARAGSSEEDWQAAALGYGYYIALFNSRIDAYIVRAYIDDPAETAAGLYLGMFDTSYNKKKSYEIYKNLDTESSLTNMNQYLSLIGISSWENAIPGFDAGKLPAVDF